MRSEGVHNGMQPVMGRSQGREGGGGGGPPAPTCPAPLALSTQPTDRFSAYLLGQRRVVARCRWVDEQRENEARMTMPAATPFIPAATPVVPG